MEHARAEQVQTWNRQLRQEGNPFRLRLTSQSPYLYLRGPFRDPPLIRSTGIHHEEANAARRAYELACELKELRGALPAQLAPAHQQPGRRFSGWVMLVQATRKELVRQGLRSTTAFGAHLNALERRHGDPSGEAVLAWIQEQDSAKRDYLARCDTAVKLIDAGLTDLQREDVLRLRQASTYSAVSVAERSLVSDEAIVAWIDSLEDRPQWQWVFGMLATYGLRPHEAFHLEGPPDEDSLIAVLPETKTGFHVSHPAPEEWIDRWSLRQMRLPVIRSDRANNLLGQAVWTKCSRLSPPLAEDGRRLSPYDLRHCWARRVHCSPDLIPFWTTAAAAESLGHSEAVHRRHYQRWITKAEQKIRARELRRRRLAEAVPG